MITPSGPSSGGSLFKRVSGAISLKDPTDSFDVPTVQPATVVVYGEPRINPTKFLVKDGHTGEIIYTETDNQHAERAIQAALDALPITTNHWNLNLQMGTIFLDLFGAWNVGAPIINPAIASGADRCNVHLNSHHPWSSMLVLADAANCSMIDWDGVFMGHISNLAFHGNKTEQSEAHPLIDMEWLQDGEFRFVWTEAGKGDAIKADRGWSFSLRNCWVEHNDGIGLHFDHSASSRHMNMIFEHTTFVDNYQHMYIDGVERSSIHNNIFDTGQHEDIEIHSDGNFLKIYGNHFVDGSTADIGVYDAIKIHTSQPPRGTIITNNTFEEGTHINPTTRYHSAVGLYNTCDEIVVANNIMYGDMIPVYIDNPVLYQMNQSNSMLYDTRRDTFDSVIAATADQIVAANDMSQATPYYCVMANNVGVPRKINWSMTHANITEFALVIYGVDVLGRKLYEYITQADGFSGVGTKAFAWISNVRVGSQTGSGVGDTLDVGTTDILGIRGLVFDETDVQLVERITGANRANEAENITASKHMVDMSGVNGGGGINTGDTFNILYRAAINTFK